MNSFSTGKILVTKFEFEGRFGMRLSRDCHEVELTLNLKSINTFVMSLVAGCHDFFRDLPVNLSLIWRELVPN